MKEAIQQKGLRPDQFALSRVNLKRRTANATVLTVVTRLLSLTIQTGTSFVLARLLLPGDFGLVGMVMPFIAVFTIFGNLGLTSGVLQIDRVSAEQISALFYINLLVSLVLACAFFVSAPLLAAFYGTPQVQPIAMLFALVILSSGLSALQASLAQRGLRFGMLLGAELSSQVLASAVAIVMAIRGQGVMALAWRAVVQPIGYSAVLWVFSEWRPGRPDWSADTRALIRYGGNALGFKVVNVFGRQTDNVLIGWRYGQSELGPYALAYRLFFMPVQMLTSPLEQVMIPTLARLRDEPDRFAKWYLAVLQLMTFFALPPIVALLLCLDDVINLVLGPKWLAAIPILRWLMPVGALHVPYVTIGWLMMAMGRADRQFRWGMIVIPLYIGSFLVGLPWRAHGVAMAYSLVNLAVFFPGFAYAIRGTRVTMGGILKSLAPAFITSGVVIASGKATLAALGGDATSATRLAAMTLVAGLVMLFGAMIVLRTGSGRTASKELLACFRQKSQA